MSKLSRTPAVVRQLAGSAFQSSQAKWDQADFKRWQTICSALQVRQSLFAHACSGLFGTTLSISCTEIYHEMWHRYLQRLQTAATAATFKSFNTTSSTSCPGAAPAQELSSCTERGREIGGAKWDRRKSSWLSAIAYIMVTVRSSESWMFSKVRNSFALSF